MERELGVNVRRWKTKQENREREIIKDKNAQNVQKVEDIHG